MVVQAGQDWDGDNGAGPLDCPTQRLVFTQGQVRADLIVISRIRRKNLPQVRFAKDQHPVQALATHGANQTLHVRILPRRSRRDLRHGIAFVGGANQFGDKVILKRGMSQIVAVGRVAERNGKFKGDEDKDWLEPISRSPEEDN
jgi:hypothetical protein